MALLHKIQQSLPPSEPISANEKQKVDAALDAVTVLAQTVLTSSRRTRFSEVARICEIGQALVKATSRRVEDLDKESKGRGVFVNVMNPVEYDDMTEDDNTGHNIRPLDENQIVRDALLSLSKASTEQQKLAGIAESEADELKSLVSLLSQASESDKTTIQMRIARLMQNMETRNAVVPSDVSRRHSTGIQGEHDDPSGNGADSYGSVSDGEPQGEGTQAGMGQAALG
jgi:hypothetical protein